MKAYELAHELNTPSMKNLTVMVYCEHDSYNGHPVTKVSHLTDSNVVVIDVDENSFNNLYPDPIDEDEDEDVIHKVGCVNWGHGDPCEGGCRLYRTARRGDNIPTIADYSHYNEEAAQVWYAENRYDMEHWDEPMDDQGEAW